MTASPQQGPDDVRKGTRNSSKNVRPGAQPDARPADGVHEPASGWRVAAVCAEAVGALDKLIRRLLGLDQKMAQYRDGAVFVRAAVDKVGMEGFNAVWAEPANLPNKQEILDPALWIARVHG